MNITLTTKADTGLIIIEELAIPDPADPILILERNEYDRRDTSDNSKSSQEVRE